MERPLTVRSRLATESGNRFALTRQQNVDEANEVSGEGAPRRGERRQAVRPCSRFVRVPGLGAGSLRDVCVLVGTALPALTLNLAPFGLDHLRVEAAWSRDALVPDVARASCLTKAAESAASAA